MDTVNVRNILHSVYRKCADSMPESAKPSPSEEEIINFLLFNHDGMATTKELAELYRQVPWLKGEIGRLRNFCSASTSLELIDGAPKLVRVIGPRAILEQTTQLSEKNDEVEETYTPKMIRSKPGMKSTKRHDGRLYAEFFKRHAESYFKLFFLEAALKLWVFLAGAPSRSAGQKR